MNENEAGGPASRGAGHGAVSFIIRRPLLVRWRGEDPVLPYRERYVVVVVFEQVEFHNYLQRQQCNKYASVTDKHSHMHEDTEV